MSHQSVGNECKVTLSSVPDMELKMTDIDIEPGDYYRRYAPIDPPEMSFSIKMDSVSYENIEELRRYCVQEELVPLTISIPQTVWIYPDWVWWKPKPENEQYYRFLNIGQEETIQHGYTIPKAHIKQVATNDGILEVLVQGYGQIDA